MYVENNETNLSEFSEESVLSDAVYGDCTVSSGDVNSVSSEGSDGDVAESTDGVSEWISDVSQGDYNTDVSGSGGQSSVQVISPDYSEVLASIDSGISALNNLTFLIFIFLLMEWTEKKIFVGVRKFTHERRR